MREERLVSWNEAVKLYLDLLEWSRFQWGGAEGAPVVDTYNGSEYEGYNAWYERQVEQVEQMYADDSAEEIAQDKWGILRAVTEHWGGVITAEEERSGFPINLTSTVDVGAAFFCWCGTFTPGRAIRLVLFPEGNSGFLSVDTGTNHPSSFLATSPVAKYVPSVCCAVD